jgi:hypothetical protein
MERSVVSACAIAWVLAGACDPIHVDKPSRIELDDAPAALRASYCERMFECACEGGRLFDSVDACMAEIEEELAALEQQPGGENIYFDPYCIGEKVDTFDELGCEPADDESGQCERPCAVYHGDGSKGGFCHVTADREYSTCGKRWRCQIDDCSNVDPTKCSGTCVDPCETNGTPCPDCDDDSYCEQSTGVCIPLAGNGDACTGHAQCASEWCPDGECGERPDDAMQDAAICLLPSDIE